MGSRDDEDAAATMTVVGLTRPPPRRAAGSSSGRLGDDVVTREEVRNGDNVGEHEAYILFVFFVGYP